MRSFATKQSNKSGESALRVVRQTELIGGQLSATLTREHLLLTAEFLKGQEFVEPLYPQLPSRSLTQPSSAHICRKLHLHTLIKNLSPSHLAHEYNEAVVHTTSLESAAAAATPSVVALEAAHKLAFRSGLGNSLFADPLEPVGLTDVHEFAASLAKRQIGIVGTGLSQEELVATLKDVFTEELAGQEGSKASGSATQYFGGEVRIPIDLHNVADGAKPTLIIAFGSTKAATPEQLVLPYLLAPRPSVKWSLGAAPLAVDEAGTTVEAFTQSYSDAALLVVEIQAEGSKRLSSAGKQVVGALQAFKADEETLKRAVAQAKTAAAEQWDSASSLREVLASAVRQPLTAIASFVAALD